MGSNALSTLPAVPYMLLGLQGPDPVWSQSSLPRAGSPRSICPSSFLCRGMPWESSGRCAYCAATPWLCQQGNPGVPCLQRFWAVGCLCKWGNPRVPPLAKTCPDSCSTGLGHWDPGSSNVPTVWNSGQCLFHSIKQISCSWTHPNMANLLRLVMSVYSFRESANK